LPNAVACISKGSVIPEILTKVKKTSEPHAEI